MENGRGRTADDALRALVVHERARGLRIHLVDRTRHLEDAAEGRVIDGGAGRGRKLSIAHARTALQTYLYAFAKGRRGAVVWILDDDMRLDPLVAGRDGRLQRRPLDLVPMLQALRRRHASGDVDITIGAYTGAPPLPFAATVRVQFVDLVASLQWLAAQDPRAVLPDPSGENAALRSGRRDYYYDLSRSETDRLETPFRVTPVFPGERVGEAFERVAGAAERILAGEQVFRPLAIEPGPLALAGNGLQRGGNTFVFDVEALRLAPNPSPAIDGRPSRRSDMLWALLQRRCFGRRVGVVPIAFYHDRSRVAAGTLDVDRVVDDVRGYAMFSALQDTPRAFTSTDNQGIELAEGAIEGIAGRVDKYLEERLAAFRLSFHRILGLMRRSARPDARCGALVGGRRLANAGRTAPGICRSSDRMLRTGDPGAHRARGPGAGRRSHPRVPGAVAGGDRGPPQTARGHRAPGPRPRSRTGREREGRRRATDRARRSAHGPRMRGRRRGTH